MIFLSSYGGMVSLAQVGLFGVAGFTMANLVAADGGLATAINPWIAVLIGLGAAVDRGLDLRRDRGSQRGHLLPDDHPRVRGHGLLLLRPGDPALGPRRSQQRRAAGVPRRHRVGPRAALLRDALRSRCWCSLACAIWAVRRSGSRCRARATTRSGCARSATTSRLHRTLAFGVGALIAAVAGILSVWYNRRIAPGSIALGQTIDVLVIAVIGGLYRLQGAWVGALVFVLLDNYSRSRRPRSARCSVPSGFNTLLGLIFLVIILISPGGLVGVWEQLRDRLAAGLGSGRGDGRPSRSEAA